MKRTTFRPRLESLEDRTLLATCTVTNLLDVGRGALSFESGEISGDLRFCINQANAMPGPDVIDFNVTGAINLTAALPLLHTDINISGPGAGVLIVRRNTGGSYRIFSVGSGATVRLSGLTVANGFVVDKSGGGILNRGILTVERCRIVGNAVDGAIPGTLTGGGISSQGSLTVLNSVIAQNKVDYGSGATEVYTAAGGGIWSAGTLVIAQTVVSGNLAYGNGGVDAGGVGGGIFHDSGMATIVDSSITNNDAFGFAALYGGGFGGGLYNAAEMVVLNSTISENGTSGASSNDAGGGFGAGIYNAAKLTVDNSTIAGNVVDEGEGAGFYTHSANVVTIRRSTIADNQANGFYTTHGGGIRIYSGTVVLSNTIVSGNASDSGPDIMGTITSLGYNLIQTSSGGSGYGPNDILGVDPMLGPLADNGGATLTMALLPGSPAIDAGNNTDAPEFDQRGPGFPRIVNGTIDIGAFEVQATGVPRHRDSLAVLITADSDRDEQE